MEVSSAYITDFSKRLCGIYCVNFSRKTKHKAIIP